MNRGFRGLRVSVGLLGQPELPAHKASEASRESGGRLAYKVRQDLQDQSGHKGFKDYEDPKAWLARSAQ